MSPRELPDFLKAGDPDLSLPRLTGIARLRAIAGVPEPGALLQHFQISK